MIDGTRIKQKRICKWVLLNRAPNSTQLYPAPISSTQLHPPNSSLYSALCNTLNVIRTKIPQGQKKLGQKNQSCPFCVEVDTHGILKVVIPIPDLDFWNSDPKIYFWANLGQKSQCGTFCLKIDIRGISKMLVLILKLAFWIPDTKFIFGQIWAERVKVVSFT